MSISNWLTNGKVSFAVVQVNSRDILVCTSNVGAHRVIFVEDALTGKRVFGPASQHHPSGEDIDKLVLELVKEL
ncbi:hypothetical protein FZC78_19245 [Rossellomorea vietnamensis]|uniref:Uncharacterized protein n=1 Tax=Rossellomorea vietnamensis TaxID=218284 RepID=A0A5D4NL52_9BACI|nr:hypothetical protein [Rossellomorea vietnamensis]TYS14291.1 hypothetical protein FZC78_19245 [Rossellomorea vietnamensis]